MFRYPDRPVRPDPRKGRRHRPLRPPAPDRPWGPPVAHGPPRESPCPTGPRAPEASHQARPRRPGQAPGAAALSARELVSQPLLRLPALREQLLVRQTSPMRRDVGVGPSAGGAVEESAERSVDCPPTRGCADGPVSHKHERVPAPGTKGDIRYRPATRRLGGLPALVAFVAFLFRAQRARWEERVGSEWVLDVKHNRPLAKSERDARRTTRRNPRCCPRFHTARPRAGHHDRTPTTPSPTAYQAGYYQQFEAVPDRARVTDLPEIENES
jgi:hypothetical protein